ncbi:MAG: hypothetical protein HGA85_05965 [Nanoarchaeota archaeon]|nr:hypothetical protein [Nanoarchaeota archaeon]
MGLSEEEIKKEISGFANRYKNPDEVRTKEFQEFKNEILPTHFSLYEKGCNTFGNIVDIKPDKKKEEALKEALETCHLNTTPNAVTSFSLIFPIVLMISLLLIAFILSFAFGDKGLGFFVGVIIFSCLMLIIPLSTLPMLFASSWRLRASNQMVLSIFYVVSYMRHTSNLELAIKFTSDHLTPPLSVDFKKIIWDIETFKYPSVRDALENYLAGWKNYSMEFVESMHLIESSLYEPVEKKRLASLEKAMSLILEATYEKMLHYAQNLKGPITMLHMLGVILPILGLVILPLVVAFMGGVEWYHISAIYNFFLPVLVWYLGKNILATRPSGYGQADITEVNPELKKFSLLDLKFFGKTYTMSPKWITYILIVISLVIGLSPLLLHSYFEYRKEYFDIVFYPDSKGPEVIFSVRNDTAPTFAFLQYKDTEAGPVGPYGLGATIISIVAPLGIALALGFYYNTSTKRLMDIRERTKELEEEFASALFQLGNRLGDGLPAEIAFSRVAEVMENTVSGKFFDIVTINLSQLGMGVEDAIFDPRYGAINKYPSSLIESSMKVFVESAKKGPDVASEALINISTYIKEMHRVDERLKDLMSEITGSMSSQINFLAPMIAGIVIGLTSMITTILTKLSDQLAAMGGDATASQGGPQGIVDMFKASLPTFYFQMVVGMYIVEIAYLLTGMLNIIQNGYDPLNEKYLLGVNFKKSGTLYAIVAVIVILIFNLVASSVVDRVNLF